MSEGWHYFVVLAGNPWLVVGNKRFRVQPGTVNITHPDCPLGHSDEPGNGCEMLTWIWRSAPAPLALMPPEGGCISLIVPPPQLNRLRKLHLLCRSAVAASNDHSSLQLRIARLQLDLCLLSETNAQQAADHPICIELAIEFLRNHLADMRAINRLREYLQTSEASLKRLFHEQTGKSPSSFFQELRMLKARNQLLPTADSVKSVAYALGYRHPADFSRAFKREFGVTADTFIRKLRDVTIAQRDTALV
jgi:AraC-like DNA-binding protein